MVAAMPRLADNQGMLDDAAGGGQFAELAQYSAKVA
jgi:hypothetical protein